MRTATCRKCGETGLSWKQTKANFGYLVKRTTGEAHVNTCTEMDSALRAYVQKRLKSDDEFDQPKGNAPGDDKDNEGEKGQGEGTPKPVPAGGDADVQYVDESTLREIARDEADKSTTAKLPEIAKQAEPSDDKLRELVREAVDKNAPKEIYIKTDDGEHKVEGNSHHMLPTLIEYAAARMNVMLVGPAGGGKTTASRQCAEALGLPYYEQGMGPGVSGWDLKGYRSPDGKYVPGKLRAPFETGGIFMLDEMDAANPSALIEMNNAASNGHFAFPDVEVAKHDDCVLVAGANTFGRGADRLYVGRSQLDAATLDRWVVIQWDYDENAEFLWAGGDQDEWVSYVQKCRKIAFDNRMRIVISPRASIFGAKLLRRGRPRDEVRENVLFKGISEDDRMAILRGVGEA